MTRKQFLIPLFACGTMSAAWNVYWFLEGKAWVAMIVPVLVCILAMRYLVRKYGSTAILQASLENMLVCAAWNVVMFILGMWSAWTNIQWWEYVYCTAIVGGTSAYVGNWAIRQ